MENRKDIGTAFREKLNDLDKTPNDATWNAINAELQKKKKRRAFYISDWMKIAGIFLLGTIVSFFVFNGSLENNYFINPNHKEVVNESSDVKNNTTPENGSHDSDTSNSILNKNTADSLLDTKTGIASQNKNESEVSTDKEMTESNVLENRKDNSFSQKKYKKNAVDYSGTSNKSIYSSEKNTRKKHKNSIAVRGKVNKKNHNQSISKNIKKRSKDKNTITFPDSPNTTTPPTELITAVTETKKEEELNSLKKDSLTIPKKEKTPEVVVLDENKKDSAATYKKFDIDVFVSPTYYGSFTKDSPLDSRLDSLSKKSEMKFSYGAGLTYDLSKKISFRIGYSKVNLSYVTQNAAINTANYSGIRYNSNISNATIYGASNGAEKMDITQNISYTEIPLEVKYKFLDKKIGLKSSLGFSYLLLNENKISIETENGFRQDIGETKNLAKTSLSVNLGLEIDYPLFKNTKIFAQPMLNYQIKAFANSNYTPYYFGIHTGIRYSFNN